MSKSYRKTPIHGNTGSSEKKDKQLTNRKFRNKKIRIKNIDIKELDLMDEEDKLPLELDEVQNKWTMTKDGKSIIHKDSDYYDKIMRK
jgi:hypothetical protein